MEESGIAFRLKQIIDSMGLNDSAFADRCGISRSTLSLLLSGKNKKISNQQLDQIHYAFPEFSILWLLFGEGNMMLSEDKSENQHTQEPSFAREKLDFIENDPGNGQDANLNALISTQNSLNQLNQNRLRLEEKIQNLESKILELQETPRKVTKITIFYDDSTFETFRPE